MRFSLISVAINPDSRDNKAVQSGAVRSTARTRTLLVIAPLLPPAAAVAVYIVYLTVVSFKTNDLDLN